jgi:hypothetical protein
VARVAALRALSPPWNASEFPDPAARALTIPTAGRHGEEGSSAMGVMFRKRQKIGPLILNFTENGFSSWSIKIGRWSWNSRARAHRVDLPGPLSWKQDKSRR